MHAHTHTHNAYHKIDPIDMVHYSRSLETHYKYDNYANKKVN